MENIHFITFSLFDVNPELLCNIQAFSIPFFGIAAVQEARAWLV